MFSPKFHKSNIFFILVLNKHKIDNASHLLFQNYIADNPIIIT